MPVAMLLAGLLYASPSVAALGGAVTKSTVQVQEQSSIVSTVQTLNVYQEKLPSGTQIKEYANADGVVVAVSWSGPTLPNLKQLLGSHFEAFANRPPSLNAGHRNAEMKTEDLVVQSHGQMRSFAGRAWLPKLLPADFNAEQIN